MYWPVTILTDIALAWQQQQKKKNEIITEFEPACQLVLSSIYPDIARISLKVMPWKQYSVIRPHV